MVKFWPSYSKLNLAHSCGTLYISIFAKRTVFILKISDALFIPDKDVSRDDCTLVSKPRTISHGN